MTDYEFCVEYVRRIPRGRYTLATSRHMIELVEEGKAMCSPFIEKHTQELFRSAPVSAFVYNFLRDNQSLFLKEQSCQEHPVST